jgi:DNA-directed RNA polymerase specialized sigma24 family protein
MTTAAQRRDRADRAAELHAAGWSARQIARKLGVSDSTVRADLRTAPAPLRPYPLPRPFDGDWRPEALRLRAAGHPDHRRSQLMPCWMVAERLGIAERDVRRFFTRLRKLETRAANAAQLRAGGMSLRQIAAAVGVSEPTVRRDLTRVRHLPARKRSRDLAQSSGIAHLHDAPGQVLAFRRTTASRGGTREPLPHRARQDASTAETTQPERTCP